MGNYRTRGYVIRILESGDLVHRIKFNWYDATDLWDAKIFATSNGAIAYIQREISEPKRDQYRVEYFIKNTNEVVFKVINTTPKAVKNISDMRAKIEQKLIGSSRKICF